MIGIENGIVQHFSGTTIQHLLKTLIIFFYKKTIFSLQISKTYLPLH